MPKLYSMILATLIAASLPGCSRQPDAPPPLAGAAIGGPFTLIDKNSRTVRWGDFGGQYRIIYVGYTFCPDACPRDVA